MTERDVVLEDALGEVKFLAEFALERPLAVHQLEVTFHRLLRVKSFRAFRAIEDPAGILVLVAEVNFPGGILEENRIALIARESSAEIARDVSLHVLVDVFLGVRQLRAEIAAEDFAFVVDPPEVLGVVFPLEETAAHGATNFEWSFPFRRFSFAFRRAFRFVAEKFLKQFFVLRLGVSLEVVLVEELLVADGASS